MRHFLYIATILMTGGCLSIDSKTTTDELRQTRIEAAERALEPNGSVDLARSLPRMDGAYSLQQAVNHALLYNLTLREAFQRRAEAQGLIEQARAEALPGLGLTASATSDLDNRGDDPETYTAALNLTQPLWRSGIVKAGLRYARLNAASVDAAIRLQAQATIAKATRYYLDVLLQQHLVNVYQESMATAERLLATSRSRRGSGTASDYEVLRAEVEVSAAKASLLQTENTLRTSRMELLQVLGADQGSEIELSDTLAFTAEKSEGSAAVRAALEHRPDLFIAQAALQMAEANVEVVRGQYGPAVDAFLRGTYARPDPGVRSSRSGSGGGDDNSRRSGGGWGDDWVAGASLNWVWFDGLARRGKLRTAQARVEQAAAALREAEEVARVEVVKALLDLDHASELYETQRKNIELAREALRMVESGFRMGRSTQIQVLDAQASLTEAMGRYYNAIHAHNAARLALRLALGLLGPDAMAAPIMPDYQLEGAPLAAAPLEDADTAPIPTPDAYPATDH